MTQPNFPDTLLDFQKTFPDEASCAAYMEGLRWPEGFSCSYCYSVGEPYRFANRRTVLPCRNCKANTRLTAGTVMQDSRTSTQFQRQMGVKNYETAFQILHKLRMAMVRPGRDKIGADGYLEIDEAFVGGRTREEGKDVFD